MFQSLPIFVDGETPIGTVDGINTAFTLENVPDPVASIQFIVNGAFQRPGLDYTFSIVAGVATITCTSAPVVSSQLQAYYRY